MEVQSKVARGCFHPHAAGLRLDSRHRRRSRLSPAACITVIANTWQAVGSSATGSGLTGTVTAMSLTFTNMNIRVRPRLDRAGATQRLAIDGTTLAAGPGQLRLGMEYRGRGRLRTGAAGPGSCGETTSMDQVYIWLMRGDVGEQRKSGHAGLHVGDAIRCLRKTKDAR